MQRHFRLTCRRIIDIQRAGDWSSRLRVTTETAWGELILRQPETGSDALKPLRCSNCGAMMKVTIRSEAATNKRRIVMWTIAGLIIGMTVTCFVMLFVTDAFAWLIAGIILATACVVPVYFALPSQLRATIYDKDGHFMLPEENGHELDEITPESSLS